MLRRIDPKSAGASAEQRYRTEFAKHIRENWILLSYFPLSALLATAVVILFTPGTFLTFMLGILAGVGLFAGLISVTMAPPRIAYWREGADGEKLTEARLEHVKSLGWHVIHDRALKWSNVDHVLVGPGGVLSIDTKNWRGVIKIENGTVRKNRRAEPSVGKSAKSIARTLNGVIREQTSISPWVKPVVVFWADFPQDHVDEDDVMYIAGETLNAWIYSLPPKLKPEQVVAIRVAIEGLPDGVGLGN